MRVKDGDWELFDYDFRSGRSVWSYFDGETTHIFFVPLALRLGQFIKEKVERN